MPQVILIILGAGIMVYYFFKALDFVFLALPHVAIVLIILIAAFFIFLKNAERKSAERKRREILRDADAHSTPFKYKIGRHGNETLAIRYGIANMETETIPYFYYAKGGVKKRNPDRDKIRWKDANTIRLKKLRKLDESKYEVQISDFRNRKAVAIIEVGTDYVKTFYPIDEGWFNIHRGLEEALKGNRSMSLKELARFHIEKTVSSH